MLVVCDPTSIKTLLPLRSPGQYLDRRPTAWECQSMLNFFFFISPTINYLQSLDWLPLRVTIGWKHKLGDGFNGLLCCVHCYFFIIFSPLTVYIYWSATTLLRFLQPYPISSSELLLLTCVMRSLVIYTSSLSAFLTRSQIDIKNVKFLDK